MTRLIPSFLLLGIVLAASGCKKDPPPPSQETQPEQVKPRAIGSLIGVDSRSTPPQCKKLCIATGKCAPRGPETCYANSGRGCKESMGCRVLGHCTLEGENCVAGSDEECKKSELCTHKGNCMAVDGRCTNVSKPSSSAE